VGADCFSVSERDSFSSTPLQTPTQASQMYTPGPAISRFTSAFDLPQKLHIVIWVARAMDVEDQASNQYCQ
jgi:hypothetical protein